MLLERIKKASSCIIALSLFSSGVLRDVYWLHFNPEDDLGRYDILLVPKDKSNLKGIILEFKYAKSDENLDDVARETLEQIGLQRYDREWKQYPYINQCVKVVIAFSEKSVATAYEITGFTTKQNSDSPATIEKETSFDKVSFLGPEEDAIDGSIKEEQLKLAKEMPSHQLQNSRTPTIQPSLKLNNSSADFGSKQRRQKELPRQK